MAFISNIVDQYQQHMSEADQRAIQSAEGRTFASEDERTAWIASETERERQRYRISGVEDLVRYQTDPAKEIIETSSRGAAELVGLGGEEAIRELDPYTGSLGFTPGKFVTMGGKPLSREDAIEQARANRPEDWESYSDDEKFQWFIGESDKIMGADKTSREGIDALEWQRSLLGLLGPEAQQFGISGIKDSPFQKEVDLRQQRKLLRQAAAGGDLGGGATIQGMTQLAGAQAGERILRKIDELQPLVDIAQTTRSGVSGIEEDVGARQMEFLSSIGPQLSNILLGQAAPIVAGKMQEANLSGLRGIGEADAQGQILGQIANLAGSTNYFGLGNIGQGTTPPLQPAAPGSVWT